MWGLARRLSLTQRMMALVVVAIVPASAALPYFIAQIHRERQSEAHDLALRTSQIAALEMDRILTGTEGILQTLALAPALGAFDPSVCDGYLAEVARRLPQLSGLAVTDAAGKVRCATGLDFEPDAAAAAPWFAAAVQGGRFAVGSYVGGRPDTGGTLPVALPVAGPGGAPEAVLLGGIDLDWLGARLRERNLARGSALAIADPEGTIIAREPDPEAYVGKPLGAQYLPLVQAAAPGTLEFTAADGTRRILGYQPAPPGGAGLYVGASFSTRMVFGPIVASTLRSIALALAGAIAACAIAWRVGDRLFRAPIRRILATIARWQAGDETARTGIAAGGSELTEIAVAIDEYMDGLVAARAERAAAEERRTLVLHEMNHRIKNVLAAVQAVANQTFRGSATPESLEAFGSRLQAMAGTHDLLLSDDWKSAELRPAVEAVLAPFDRDGRRRFLLDGPPARINARAALALSMTLHELCTNAAKYGALSAPDGRVTIRWRLDGRRFRLDWTEAGGPPVAEPDRAGFGSQLIRTALAGEVAGTAELAFPPEGARFSLDAAADRILADPPGSGA